MSDRVRRCHHGWSARRDHAPVSSTHCAIKASGWASAAEVDGVERRVVVWAVVIRTAARGHEAPRSAVGRARSLDRVLVVIATRLAGQHALAVLEDLAVLRIGERAAFGDELESVVGLGR